MNQTDRNGSGATPRRKFAETYKRHAVELTLHGDRSVKTVAKELGIPAWALYEWRKLYAPRPGDGGAAPQTLEEAEKEIGRLRAEVIRLRDREVVLKNHWASSPKRPRAVCLDQSDEGRASGTFVMRLAGSGAQRLLPLAAKAAEHPAARGRGHRYGSKQEDEGQIYINTQSWAVIAETLLGNGDRAYEYYRAFMPAAYNDRADPRESEPYVHCQTTYAPCNRNAGKSRVPWLSGTVSWSHHTALQWILGVRPEIDGLRIDPCVPKTGSGFTMRRCFRGMPVKIEVRNPDGLSKGVKSLTVDRRSVVGNFIPLDQLRDGARIVAILG